MKTADETARRGIDWSRWRLRWRRRWQALTIRPSLTVVVLIGLFCVADLTVSGVLGARRNAHELALLGRVPVGTLNTLVAAIDANRVVGLRRVLVNQGSWLDPNRVFWVVARTRTGPGIRVRDMGVVSTAFWKTILDSSLKHPVRLRDGFGLKSDGDRLDAYAGMALVILMILAALVLAQRLVEEVLVGGGIRRARPDARTTLDSVIGHDDLKPDLRALIQQVNHPRAARRAGLEPPRGILLSGDPGVGKTMIAAALANEMKAGFFEVSGSEFVQLYAGSGPLRIRRLFRRARMESTAVVFIDEVDAVGSRQTMGLDTERRAALNQLLVEMDGLRSDRKVLVIGATNQPDELDPALRRPGRFTQTFHLERPRAEDRQRILEHYTREVPLAPDVDLAALARRAIQGTGATLREWVEDAKRMAARRAEDGTPWTLTQADFSVAEERATLGVARTEAVPIDARRVAVHELGHALVGHHLRPRHRIERVTLLGRGGALGYTTAHPIDEGMLSTEGECRATLAFLLAGRAAEALLMGEVSTGAEDDLARASALARRMVTAWGMSGGLATHHAWSASNNAAPMPTLVIQRIDALLEEAGRAATEVIRAHETWMRERTEQLLSRKTLLFGDLFEAPSAAAPDATGPLAAPP